MIGMVMPEGANFFDQETMSFFYVAPPAPELAVVKGDDVERLAEEMEDYEPEHNAAVEGGPVEGEDDLPFEH